ncbi:MAG: hypothetical protein OXH66_14330 [Gemmatimonadetes bacterium]|nr:hypothetical protein [Gemmatimonadota bacterium]
MTEVSHDGSWNDHQDPVPRYALVELYDRMGWDYTPAIEVCERTAVWSYLIQRALNLRHFEVFGKWKNVHPEARRIGDALGGPAGFGYYRSIDIPRCDVNRIVEAIEDTGDETIRKWYGPYPTGSAEQREWLRERNAWVDGFAAIAAERVTFQALDGKYFFGIDVGDESRLFFIDAQQPGLDTFSATECAIAEDGVTLKKVAGQGGTDSLVTIKNGLTGRIVKLLRDPQGTKPVGAKLVTSATLPTGDSVTLDANALLADWSVSVEDVPEETDTDDSP